MKNFLLGTVFGMLISGLIGAGVLYKMGKLERAVLQVRESVSEKVREITEPPPKFEVAVAEPDDPEPVKLGIGAKINKPIFPDPNNAWNRDISQEPVDRMSDAIIRRIGADRPLHPEFGAVYRGAPNGIPYTVVSGDQAKVPVLFDRYGEQSDKEPYPIPPDVPIEGGPQGRGDRHSLLLDRDNWKLYELYDLRPQANGQYVAASGAIFDLRTGGRRPNGWTSADAAGLPILPGLVRYDETMGNKEIKHALRFTVAKSKRDYISPAKHHAGHGDDSDLPPMGMRVRLKKDFDTSGYPTEAQVILKALQTYGMILADNGEPWFISGAPDPRWVDINTHAIKKVRGRDLEVVKMR
jgi:hypothetical protein